MKYRNDLLDALGDGLPENERLILCGFEGSPFTAGPTAWKPRPWRPGKDINLEPHWNGYVTVASFVRASDNSFRRRTETFASGLALMVDDVGTKVDHATVAGVPPSMRVETSPGNEQWWYLLDKPERDMARFDGVIRAFISGKLLGSDPGMSGVTRVGRLPGYVNGKPAHNGWRVNLLSATGQKFSVEELLERFDLKLNGRRVMQPKLHSDVSIERNAAFMAAYKFLDQRRMLKRHEPDPSGWTEMTCFNVGQHTGSVDNGCAIREPADENGFYGAYKCNHGHCVDLGWADLTDWIAEQAAEELERAAS